MDVVARARGHEFLLCFVELCRIVSISIDGGRGDWGLQIVDWGLQDVSLDCSFDRVVIVLE